MKGILPKVRKSITVYLKKTKNVPNMTASRFWICITHPLKTICLLFIVTKLFNVYSYNRESTLSFSLFKFLKRMNVESRLVRKFMVVFCLDESSLRYSALTYVCRDSNSVVRHDCWVSQAWEFFGWDSRGFYIPEQKEIHSDINTSPREHVISEKQGSECETLLWYNRGKEKVLRAHQLLLSLAVLVSSVSAGIFNQGSNAYIYSCRRSCRLNLEPILASIGQDAGYTLHRLAICSERIFMLSLSFCYHFG